MGKQARRAQEPKDQERVFLRGGRAGYQSGRFLCTFGQLVFGFREHGLNSEKVQQAFYLCHQRRPQDRPKSTGQTGG